MVNAYNPKRGFEIYEKRIKFLVEDIIFLGEYIESGRKVRWRDEQARIIDKETRYEVLKRQCWACNKCGTKLKFSSRSKWEGEIAHIDHIHPFADRKTYNGGEDRISELCNLQALCERCNKTKGKKKG